MWVKKLDVNELSVEFMPRSMDPLDKAFNKYDNMVEDEEDFDEIEIDINSSGLRFEVTDTIPETIEDKLPASSVLYKDRLMLTPSEEEGCWEYFLNQGSMF